MAQSFVKCRKVKMHVVTLHHGNPFSKKGFGTPRYMLSLPRFGHVPARKMAAGKSAPTSGMLLDFLLQDPHSLLEVLGPPSPRTSRR